MSNVKPKTVAQFLLFAALFAVLILLSGFLESAPINIAVVVGLCVAAFFWIVWFILEIREARRLATRGEDEVGVSFDPGFDYYTERPDMVIYDQDKE